MLVKVVKFENVKRDLEILKKVIGKREVVVFGSLIKNSAVEKESDLDIAVKGKLPDNIRNLIYSEFAEKIYNKYKLVLLLHEIRENEWKSFLKRIGEYKKI